MAKPSKPTVTSTASFKSTAKRPALSRPPAAAARGTKRVFKQIEILSSDDSDNEEEYVPPKNYKDDDDDDSSDDESVGSGSDIERKKEKILEEINESLPEDSHLSRKRKVKKSRGVYERATENRETDIL